MRITSFKLLLFSAILSVVITNCTKNDPPLPPVEVNFAATELGFQPSENEISVTIELSRADAAVTPVTIALQTTGVTPGVDFTTNPALKPGNDTLKIQVPANTTATTFKITKTSGLLLSGTENITFTLANTGTAVTGTKKSVKVSFGTIVSTGSAGLVLPGKTDVSPYANGVYIDLSNNAAIAADRKSWNLGFVAGSGFNVVLNPANGGRAWKLNKTDIATAITTADTTGTGLDFGAYSTPLKAVDDLTGDLTKTVFGNIVAEAESKVVIYTHESAATADDWYRVKVSKDGEKYKVQYAKIKETTVKTVTIDKVSDYNLVFFSLENNKIVAVEPKAKNWDIQWSYSTYNAGTLAYNYQDFILLNSMAGAEAVEVVKTTETAAAAFTAFAEADLAGLTFLKTRDAIGSKWRVTSGTPLGIRKDRFYVVKDASGNYYKLRFNKMGLSDTGERGRPEIEYVLVKKGN